MNIYVGNLDFKVQENELQEIFSEYGTVKSTKIITDKYNGKSKGFGFVEMESSEEGNKAINGLNETTYENRKILVSEARTQNN